MAAVLLAVGAGTAGAQGVPLLSVSVGGGGTFPLPDADSTIGAGWNVGVGATFRVTNQVAIRLDYQYSRFASETVTVPYVDPVAGSGATMVSGRVQMHVGSFDAVFSHPVRDGRASVYVLGGPSIARRRATVTGTAPGDAVGFCEPQWLRCADGPVPFDQAMGVQETTNVGANVGGGFAVAVGLQARLFVEARYLWIHGDAYAGPSGPERASAAFLPIMVGLRF
jgi:opacity protein-like surface antigen